MGLVRVSVGPTGRYTLVGGNAFCKRGLKPEPAGVERSRPELFVELGDRRRRVVFEEVLHHPDLTIVHERHVDV